MSENNTNHPANSSASETRIEENTRTKAHGDSFSPLAVTFGVCVLLAAAVGFLMLPGKNNISARNFTFEALDIDAKRLEKERDEKYKSVQLDQVPDEWAQFLNTAREVNRFDFVSPGAAAEASTIEKLSYYSNELVPATGYEGFLAATIPLRDACSEGLDTLRKALGAGDVTLEQALSDPPADRFGQYRDNCGNLLAMLVERGLVDKTGAWTSSDAPLVTDILSRYRAAHLLKDQYSPWLLLTSYETEIFARWRVEQAAGYSDAKRLQYLSEIPSLLPHYNVDFARGVLAYQAKDIAGALKAFETLHQRDPKAGYEGYVRYLKEQVPAG
ncbi:hypothetical protein [Bradymonas sediminis]|uniref:Uncharacterized protein n=1 Tax=Bradymonas sediminis TaxID=1548548 RepID=A0A2Z4FK58_9DELT|nr:hypothetical protein [Bradymonas sediminis]AWV89333.1 hypothetical protein DN745_08270 [Bradymonas sediminis]TDP73508.1 hypothetical protein DFR33_106149 [Bradymonas sediminis]